MLKLNTILNFQRGLYFQTKILKLEEGQELLLHTFYKKNLILRKKIQDMGKITRKIKILKMTKPLKILSAI